MNKEYDSKIRTAHISGVYTVIVAIVGLVSAIITFMVSYYAGQKNMESVLYEDIKEYQLQIINLEKALADSDNSVASLVDKNLMLEKQNDLLKQERSKLVEENGSSKNVESQSEDRIIPISSDVGKDLLSVCPPYDGNLYDLPKSIKMGGMTYTNGFSLDSRNNGRIYFNLNGKYTSLEFDLGPYDNSNCHDAVFSIYLDGTITQTLEVKANDLPKHMTIQLNKALQLRIEADSGNSWYGFVNAKVY